MARVAQVLRLHVERVVKFNPLRVTCLLMRVHCGTLHRTLRGLRRPMPKVKPGQRLVKPESISGRCSLLALL